MGTLSAELAALAERQSERPRIYADANIPQGVVGFMRTRLNWDVFFVMEHDDLRRARDGEHFRRAREMRRTLLSLDHDYLDDRMFPPAETTGVLVLAAPDERLLTCLLSRLDRRLFRVRGKRAGADGQPPAGLPLSGRKLAANLDWNGAAEDLGPQ